MYTEPQSENPESHAENVRPEISKESLQRYQAQKALAARFGEVVGFLMQSPAHKHFSLTDLEWLILPALLRNQISLAEINYMEKGLSKPVGLVAWAKVSEAIDKRLSDNPNQTIRLQPNEWNSGEIYWIIEALGAQKIVKPMIETLRNGPLKDKEIKLRFFADDRGFEIKAIEPGQSLDSVEG